MEPRSVPDNQWLCRMFSEMQTIRKFEEALSEQMEAGPWVMPVHLCIGQEAVAAGVCAALEPQDTVWGCHRSHGHFLAKGGNLDGLMAEILGRTSGCSGGRGGSMHIFDDQVGILGTVPLVGATIPLAVGAALSYKLRVIPLVAVAFFGDGATEEGSFHESMNLAAAYRLPVLFVVENNLYASHMHILERRAEDNIQQCARAYGMPGEELDGNDVEAVHAAAARAVAGARQGCGPVLLECRTFRWRGHVGPSWDLDVGVQRNDMLQEWLPRDPIARCRAQLLAQGATDSELDALVEEAHARVQASLAAALAAPFPGPETLHDHLFTQA